MNYPNGVRRTIKHRNNNKFKSIDYRNRGMNLETDINMTNDHYLALKRANINKKPTPIQIVNVHYPKRSAAVITEAYFQSKSTTDYNGIYRGKYVDFEAKETKNKTLFPLNNIHAHQFEHMESIIAHDGICFLIIRFSVLEETYLFPGEKLIERWKNMLADGKKSIAYEEIKKYGYFIPFRYDLRVDYLSVIDKLYFNNDR